MFSFRKFLAFMLIVIALMASFSSAQPIDEERPIFMERREASAFGDIIGELKGKGLGGRMRFGKRSSSPSDISMAELRAIYGGGPVEYVQL
ncbi:Protein CBR-FLP-27 [Caenorhabditis briggsae]|uniref:FMRFamide-like neuropeptides 27 n=2 Tax=Caenorhabditis briggsae TaxID=6238 RepID=FLP27_CAEBR|nr:Protein CBR-FLP-27 [Caenorhabditis briggsae]A8WU84.1 RecName: Full=FMRFamide-like neuropeptides 27; Contains: RecName: Full=EASAFGDIIGELKGKGLGGRMRF-amide; Flags: Precursor [Caenorhabditis briggsae]ULU06839.1 hypothetical protein L3Y34_018555 [Caenorhabditis briggsae]UMM18766.1 hypothetical protein L5515_014678 [Caenorhabditis briggsae]CAP24046.1 Protein CBR-FLP-27 [Caenorhabditis briggsae]